MGLFTRDIKTMNDLFVHQLQDIYYAEQQLVKALPKMAEKASEPQLKKGFLTHLDETKNHVERLKQVFQMHGAQVKALDCPAIDGIIEEADETSGEVADKAVMDVPSTLSCTIREVLIKPGDKVSRGSVIAHIEPAGEGAVAPVAEAAPAIPEAEPVVAKAEPVAAAPAPSVQAALAPAAEEVRKPQLALAGPAVRKLARELGRYGIAPVPLRDETGKPAKGYTTYSTTGNVGLADAWARYLPAEPASQGHVTDPPVTPQDPVTGLTCEVTAVTAVTAQDGRRPNRPAAA